jgi:hypothetical protein
LMSSATFRYRDSVVMTIKRNRRAR